MSPATQAVLLAAIALLPGNARSQTEIKYENAFPGLSFQDPVYMGELPGRPGAFIVLEQHLGQVTLVTQSGGAWSKSEFYKTAVNDNGEMGMLGIAFHPAFPTNRRYFISYDPPGTYVNVVEEREADPSLLKDLRKTRDIFRIADPFWNHNGGTIAFGPKDGFLYYGTGDGGDGNDPKGNGQNKNVLLAKFLRVDVDRQENGKGYAIPADNPFAKGGGSPEIFAYGMRNPWKWSFDPVTGDLWAGDVGQDTQEEVDIIRLGGNYGWNHAEGYDGNAAGDIGPVHAYGRNPGGNRCIIGGHVYRGDPLSKYYGHYIFGDFEGRHAWSLKPDGMNRVTATLLPDPPQQPSSFGTDSRGALYLVGYDGTVYRMLEGGPAGVRGSAGGRLGRRFGAVFACAPGSRLDASAFGAAASLEILTLSGIRAGRVSPASAMVPAGLEAGLYILKAGSGAKSGLLLVR